MAQERGDGDAPSELGSDPARAEPSLDNTGNVQSPLPDRRARLAALKARRPSADAERNGVQPKRPPLALAQRMQAKLGGGEGGAQQFRRQMVMRVYKMLTRTPDDGSGMVPGTPFTKAGVAELMTALHERAANQNAPGAKVATNAIGFLKPAEGDEEAVAGASVAKLQLVARMASRFGGGLQ